MKRFITLLLLSFAISSAMAEMPARAQKLVDSPRVKLFYDAVDKFDSKFPDAVSDFEYSCSSRGDIFFGRRIIGKFGCPPSNTRKKVMPALEEINHVIDSIHSMPRKYYLAYSASGNGYGVDDRPGDYECALRCHPTIPVHVIELKDAFDARTRAEDYTEGMAVKWQGDIYMIVQEVSVDTETRCGAPDMSAIEKYFDSMPDHTKRNRTRIAYKKTKSGADWRKVYALFCDHLWTQSNIAISYSRANRTISLEDRASGVTYTATYLDNLLTLKIER